MGIIVVLINIYLYELSMVKGVWDSGISVKPKRKDLKITLQATGHKVIHSFKKYILCAS